MKTSEAFNYLDSHEESRFVDDPQANPDTALRRKLSAEVDAIMAGIKPGDIGRPVFTPEERKRSFELYWSAYIDFERMIAGYEGRALTDEYFAKEREKHRKWMENLK